MKHTRAYAEFGWPLFDIPVFSGTSFILRVALYQPSTEGIYSLHGNSSGEQTSNSL